MLSINRLLILPQGQLPSSPWIFINHYRWCGHHVLNPGMCMFRIVKLYYSLWTIFLLVLICFLSTPLLRQKKHIEISFVYPGMSWALSFLFLIFHWFYAAVILFLPLYKQTTNYWVYIWLLKHHLKIHWYSAQLMRPISEEKASVGPIF